MGSSGKKKTTMAKLARENRLRERRFMKQAKKDARRQASTDQPDAQEPASGQLDVRSEESGAADRASAGAGAGVSADEAARAFREVDPQPTDPRGKEVALTRLKEASDAELAVFEGTLREDAFAAGATEQEMRQAQRAQPEHGG